MSKFEQLMEDALKRGDRTDAEFRRSVYGAFLKAFEKSAQNSVDPDVFRAKFKPHINDIIMKIEKDILVEEEKTENEKEATWEQRAETSDIGALSADTEDVATTVFPDPPYVETLEPGNGELTDQMPKSGLFQSGKKPGLVKLLALGLGLLIFAAIAFSALSTLVNTGVPQGKTDATGDKDSTVHSDTNANTMTSVKTEDKLPTSEKVEQIATADDPAELVNITVGNGFTTSGKAKWLVVDGMGLLTDSSPEDIDLYQWIVREIPVSESHKITMVVQPREAENPYLQFQAVYSSPGKPSRNYIFVLNLASGVVDGKGEFGFSGRTLPKNADGDYIFEAETTSIDAVSNLQIIIMPVLSSNSTGSAFINRLAIEKAG